MFVAAAEPVGASEGLGFLLTDGEQTGRPEVVIGAIVLFAVLGRLSDRLLAWGAARLLIRGA
jgi:sulfonate transport system permease protein